MFANGYVSRTRAVMVDLGGGAVRAWGQVTRTRRLEREVGPGSLLCREGGVEGPVAGAGVLRLGDCRDGVHVFARFDLEVARCRYGVRLEVIGLVRPGRSVSDSGNGTARTVATHDASSRRRVDDAAAGTGFLPASVLARSCLVQRATRVGAQGALSGVSRAGPITIG